MHFHLPKPLHGWRAFAGEVGIIVLGVLIALAFEAAVDRMNWNSKVAEARQELRYELGVNLADVKNRIGQQPCAERRLDELGIILNRAAATGRLPPLGSIGRPSHYSWPESVWETQISAQTASHFPAHELASIARVYRVFESIHQLDDLDRSAWLALSTMTGPGRSVDAATIDRLVQALAQARYANHAFGEDEGIVETILARGGPGKDFPEVDPSNPPISENNIPLCGPIGQVVPATYGVQ